MTALGSILDEKSQRTVGKAEDFEALEEEQKALTLKGIWVYLKELLQVESQ